MFKSKIQNPKSKINPNFKFQMTKSNSCHLSFGFCHLFVIWILSFVILTSGCATIIEGAKGVAGISTKVLEKGRKNAIKKTFNYDYNTCYDKVKDILSHTGTYIYAQDIQKAMIAVYISTEDTTPVGVFFKEIDADNTQVEVSSPSKYAKELISARIFDILNPPEKKNELATPQKNQKEP